MKLSVHTYFDNEDGSFVAERYFIDGNEVSEDAYDEMMEEMDKANDCCEEENCCDCYECTIDRYVQLLSEITGGCPNCIRSVLDCFCDDIIEHIVIDSVDEGEGIENKELLN